MSARPYVAFVVPPRAKADRKPESASNRRKTVESNEIVVCELAGAGEGVEALKALQNRLVDWAPQLAIREIKLPHAEVLRQLP